MPSVKDRRRSYPSDLSEEQWDAIKDLIPSARTGGRPRTTDPRVVINAILYLINSGCAWRYLPHEFPPWKTVYHYYRAWIYQGVWRVLHQALRSLVRVKSGKSGWPSYLILDSQSVRAPSGEHRGHDGFKRVRGRKRQILVDTLGLVHGVHVHAANLSDTKEGGQVLAKLSSEVVRSIRVLHADMGYRGVFEGECYAQLGKWPLINRRENTGQGKRKGALEKKNWRRNRPQIKEPKRWIVERTLGWFGHYRRLSRDYEKKVISSETMIYLAMTQLMLRWIHPAKSL